MLKKLWTQAVLAKRTGAGWSGLRTVFSLLSLPYYLAVAGRLWLYRFKLIKPAKLPVPVISVGNITVGGTGKTPMVIWLAKKLTAREKKAGIISRGYGRVSNDESTDDEMIANQQTDLKNVVRTTGRNRILSGKKLIDNYGVDALIMDDGFQHLKLHRDINVVMIDCLNPFGQHRLLPAGLLREPLSGLQRADIFVLTRTDQVNREIIKQIETDLKKFNKPVLKSIHRPAGLIPLSNQQLLDLNELAGKKYFGFCGIGNPAGFQKTLEQLSGRLTGLAVFPDHYDYKTKDLELINRRSRETQADLLITTEKDARRLKHLPPHQKLWRGDVPIYALKIELVVTEGESVLNEMLRGHI